MANHDVPLETDGREEAVLEAVAFAAERFLTEPSWEEAIGEVMAGLGRAAGAALTHLFRWEPADDSDLRLRRLHTWRAPGMFPASHQTTRPDEAYGQLLERWSGQLQCGEAVHGRRGDFPEPELTPLASAGSSSVAAAPIFAEGRWWGAIVLEDRGRDAGFRPPEIEALKAVGMMLGAAIQRERMERDLRQAEVKFRTLVEQIPAVTYIDAIGGPAIPLYMSPQYERLFGYTAEERMAEPDMWAKLLHPEDRERALAESDRTAATGEPFKGEYRMIARDGRVVWIHDEAVLVRDGDGMPLFWQGVLFDISERKQAEELEVALKVEQETSQHLRELNAMKDGFLTAVSHELRTPLASILGIATTLDRSEEDLTPQEHREMLEMLVASAHKLNRLLSDLLDVDRLTRGIVVPRRGPVDVAEVARRVIRETWPWIDRRVEVDAEPARILADGGMVERILENLLANAVRHTPEETPVWVRVRRQVGGALIAVEDAGPGVRPELREAIFEPFRQGPEAPTHTPGVGVGLSLVARFAELHGGRAWVEDRKEGGASFRVLLPDGFPDAEAASA